MTDLDLASRFTFENFVVGTGNRLSVAAAKRVAESPGASYNPLFIYSASGLGKTHLVTAIGHHARRIHPDAGVVFDTLEHFMEEAVEAIEAGDRDDFRARFGGTGLLILDDVQFLAGKPRTQEELLRVWDALSARGGQIVLTSDRPPQEIDALDDRLLSRFSGGLIVDIGAPDFETRVAILRRKAEEQGQSLDEGVAEALARSTFSNVRELQGALNRILAVQELEGRTVAEGEVARLIGATAKRSEGEFDSFMADITSAVSTAVSSSPEDQQLAEAILRWEGEGYQTRRLEAALDTSPAPEEVEALVRRYEADVERLREIVDQIRGLEEGAHELARAETLRDPDRIEEAEHLLAGVRMRTRPLPQPPLEHTFDGLELDARLFSVRAARAAAEQPGERYNPLFIHGGESNERSVLLGSLGNALATSHPRFPVAFVRGRVFASEVIEALEQNQVDGWRARYRGAWALLLDDVDALADTERAQEELFHLFEFLQRAGAQLAFTGSRAPAEMEGLEERLRTRLGSGLVVPLLEFDPESEPESRSQPEAEPEGELGAASLDARSDEEDGPVAGDGTRAAAGPDQWFLSPEKVLWSWPYADDWLMEDLD